MFLFTQPGFRSRDDAVRRDAASALVRSVGLRADQEITPASSGAAELHHADLVSAQVRESEIDVSREPGCVASLKSLGRRGLPGKVPGATGRGPATRSWTSKPIGLRRAQIRARAQAALAGVFAPVY